MLFVLKKIKKQSNVLKHVFGGALEVGPNQAKYTCHVRLFEILRSNASMH